MSGSNTPPLPPGWNKTISDLTDELNSGFRKTISSSELEWAQAYESELLPADVRFPKKDDIYEALEDIEISYLTSWAAPFTGGGKAILKRGEKIKAASDPVCPRPIAVSLKPVDYSALEERMVPSSERESGKYGGFYFVVGTLDLNRKFKLIE